MLWLNECESRSNPDIDPLVRFAVIQSNRFALAPSKGNTGGDSYGFKLVRSSYSHPFSAAATTDVQMESSQLTTCNYIMSEINGIVNNCRGGMSASGRFSIRDRVKTKKRASAIKENVVNKSPRMKLKSSSFSLSPTRLSVGARKSFLSADN